VLAEDLRLDELERVEGLRRRQEALELAQLVAIAFHEPKKLEGVARDLDRERRRVALPSVDEAQAKAAEVENLISLADRIERRKRRQQGATGSA